MFNIEHTKKTNKFLGMLYIYLVKAISKNPDIARREFILNILLLGIIVITLPSFVINIYKYFTASSYHGMNPIVTGTILCIFSYLLWLSRKGKSKFVSWIFISLLFILNLYLGTHWGPDLPEFLLVYSLLIIMASILIDSKKAIVISLISGIVILVLSVLKRNGLLATDDTWRYELVHLSDAIIYVITLGIIALVSWLFNREMEQALKRAQRSEAALKKQRDELEITVEKRTKQLIQTQEEKMEQVYKFAQFGKSASGLFHDLLSPLTLVSLNLNKLSRTSLAKKELSNAQVALKRAVDGTRRLENYLLAARKQIQNQQIRKTFSLNQEIDQVLQVLDHRARENKIQIKVFASLIKIMGNPLKFNQLVTNLISNAIDAYDTTQKKERSIEISLNRIDRQINLEVKDYGVGIEEKDLPHIFEALYTTKGIDKGTGIGLSICKEIVENDFKGTILVESKKAVGSTFRVNFPIRHG